MHTSLLKNLVGVSRQLVVCWILISWKATEATHSPPQAGPFVAALGGPAGHSSPWSALSGSPDMDNYDVHACIGTGVRGVRQLSACIFISVAFLLYELLPHPLTHLKP